MNPSKKPLEVFLNIILLYRIRQYIIMHIYIYCINILYIIIYRNYAVYRDYLKRIHWHITAVKISVAAIWGEADYSIWKGNEIH